MVRKWITTGAFMLTLFAFSSVEAADMSGKVTTTMDAGGYTYVEFEKGDGSKVWAAAPQTKVKVGDSVSLPAATTPMANFSSKSLNRTFEEIYFVGAITVSGGAGGQVAGSNKMPPGHPNTAATAPGADINFGPMQKAKGGHTIEELYKSSSTLSGKSIIVKGKVIKASQGIMGKNWIHIKDGTGKAGEDDLTLTTQQVVKVGDIVTAKGTYASDKDFGGGYVYKVIIENTSFQVEN